MLVNVLSAVRSYPPVNVHPTSFLLSFDPVVRSCDTACVLRCAATAGCEAASFFSEDGQCRMMGAASRLLATREEDAGGIDAYVIDHVKSELRNQFQLLYRHAMLPTGIF